MIIVGIDPGLDGGLAAISPDEMVLSVMPVVSAGTRRLIDEQAFVQWLTPFAIKKAKVFIEAVASRPGQGVVAMFTFGTGWGLVRGICAGLGMSYELVRPQEWQGSLLRGQPQGSEYLVASRLWPSAAWRATERSSKPHSGLVDAALIAEYGRRRLNGLP
jgi:hypothetical protein